MVPSQGNKYIRDLKLAFEQHVGNHLEQMKKTGVLGFGGLRNRDLKLFIQPFADQIEGKAPRMSTCIKLAKHVDKTFEICPETIDKEHWGLVEGGKLHKWLLSAKRTSLSF